MFVCVREFYLLNSLSLVETFVVGTDNKFLLFGILSLFLLVGGCNGLDLNVVTIEIVLQVYKQVYILTGKSFFQLEETTGADFLPLAMIKKSLLKVKEKKKRKKSRWLFFNTQNAFF